MTQPLVVTDKVTGDITSCKIERSLLKVDRQGAFAVTEANTYQTYSVCTGEVIDTYTVEDIRVLPLIGIGIFFGAGIVIGFVGLIFVLTGVESLIRGIIKSK